ncbi:MAG: VanZ family protein [Flavobacterium sp.]|nr:VanZ family protein [Flavobacterium sp.]
MKSLRLKQFLPAIAYLAFTFYLFTLPGDEIPKLDWEFPLKIDKLVHIGLFLILVIGFTYPFKKSILNNFKRKKCFLYITLLGILYGVIIEIIQKYFIINRSFDLFDILSDSIGSCIGYLIASYWFGKREA